MQKAGEGSAKQLGVRALSGLLGERGSSLLREASEQREAGRYLAGRLQHGSLPGLAARTSRPLRSSYRAKSRAGLAAEETGWGQSKDAQTFPMYLALSCMAKARRWLVERFCHNEAVRERSREWG